MSTLEVTLPDPLREFVEAQVSAGRAPSASDFVRKLVRDISKSRTGRRWKPPSCKVCRVAPPRP